MVNFIFNIISLDHIQVSVLLHTVEKSTFLSHNIIIKYKLIKNINSEQHILFSLMCEMFKHNGYFKTKVLFEDILPMGNDFRGFGGREMKIGTLFRFRINDLRNGS